VYKLVNGHYQLQEGEPYWMAELGLGIGRCQVVFGNLIQEQLAWFDQQGNRCLSEAEAEHQQEIERQRAEAERQQKERLAARLRELGEDSNQLI
jgi:hypothetical protein